MDLIQFKTQVYFLTLTDEELVFCWSALSWWEMAVWTTSTLRSWAASWKENSRSILRTRSSDKVRLYYNHKISRAAFPLFGCRGVCITRRGDSVYISYIVYIKVCVNTSLSFTAKRQDEDYDEQVEETLQDEVNILTSLKESKLLWKPNCKGCFVQEMLGLQPEVEMFFFFPAGWERCVHPDQSVRHPALCVQ